MQHREVLAPEVLAAAEPVDRARAAVLVELLGEQLASPDVQHERDAGLGETGPDRLEVDVGRREASRRFGRQPDGGDPKLERGSCIARTPGGGVIDASIRTQLDRIAEVLLPGDAMLDSDKPAGVVDPRRRGSEAA